MEGLISNKRKKDLCKKMLKGQAATEFLVTYGWAIVLVLVIMTILYSSIFKPEFYVAERCDIGPGISCDNFYLKQQGNDLNFTLYAHNTLGFKANITEINFTLHDRINNQKYTKIISQFNFNPLSNQDSFNTSVLFTPNQISDIAPGTLYSVYFTIKFKNNEIPNAPEHVTAGIVNVRIA